MTEVPKCPSEETFRRFFVENGFILRTLTHKPVLRKVNIDNRLLFAHEHLNWTVEDWSRVWWSDETTIEAIPQKKEYKIWVHYYDSKSEMPTAPAVQGGGFKVTFWGAVAESGLGPLVPLVGNLNGQKYIELLKDNFIDIYNDSRPKIMFMQDNAACHTSSQVLAFLEEEGVDVLKWPAQSPDLNPIENLWAILKGRMKKYSDFPRNRGELIARATECWTNLKAEADDNTLHSMPKRMQMVISAKGAPIKY